MKLKGIITIARPAFLILSVILGFLGAAVAWYEHQEYGGAFNLGYAFLAGFGLIVAHIAVNVFNDYFDFRSTLDLKTSRTPFSGGSGALPTGLITKNQALWVGIICLIIIIPIGIYFTVVSGWLLLPLLVIAITCIILYTPFILRMGYPEWSAGLGLGILPVIGAYFIQTGTYTISVLLASIPSGILVHNLLLLNEFPDAAADVTVKRRTLPIFIGKQKAAIFYSALTVLIYLWIIGTVISRDMPVFTLLGLLTFPLAFKAIDGAFKFDDMSKLVPAMANNVFVVLLTQLLMGVGFILGGIF
ncbi:MAG: prenyltransferase [Dehalococcoidales bacterium]|nr:prenyltransferase [Dehalococcoidales bacterium]